MKLTLKKGQRRLKVFWECGSFPYIDFQVSYLVYPKNNINRYVLLYTNSMIFSFSHHLQQDLGYSDVLGLDLLGFGIYVSGLGRTGRLFLYWNYSKYRIDLICGLYYLPLRILKFKVCFLPLRWPSLESVEMKIFPNGSRLWHIAISVTVVRPNNIAFFILE